MASRTLIVPNPLGLHARAAARFVRTASTYESQIQVSREGVTMDGKSIMGLLLLAAARGTRITITATGGDADSALSALCRLVERGFDDDPCND